MDKTLHQAATLAARSNQRNRIGALVVRNGAIIAMGVNARKPGTVVHSDGGWRASSAHAEEVALTRAGTLARGATLVVARVNRNGEPLLAKPCARCSGLAERLGVATIKFTE
jgi:pyrimidine deaminase RibD-like protein